MHPVLGLLQYIPYNLILNRIISGRWGPASGTLFLALQNVNFMPANFVAPPPILENENCVTSQCPEFYAEDALMLSQVIYLGLLWLGLIVLLNPGVTIGNFTKKYLKPRWWLIINSMWIWVKQLYIIHDFCHNYMQEQLVSEFPSVFQEALPGLPPNCGIQHKIELKGSVPKAHPIYFLTHQ
ncbi:hypothetical protein DSO57_1006831 [Entomophthora muscae]|uniref:Uncharacterized protein n=1 Tax=Entomophthora muscae TaxID=34485 RepID=A0ACC2TV26_9FUNG|nr:hypothetical protein DSO57_1006831 [Entomophthora muscae]